MLFHITKDTLVTNKPYIIKTVKQSIPKIKKTEENGRVVIEWKNISSACVINIF